MPNSPTPSPLGQPNTGGGPGTVTRTPLANALAGGAALLFPSNANIMPIPAGGTYTLNIPVHI